MPLPSEELTKIHESIAKVQRMKRNREKAQQPAPARRQYFSERRQKIKAGVWEGEQKEKKQRLAQNLYNMNLNHAALGFSDSTAAAMTFVADGVASVVHDLKGRCYLSPPRREPGTACMSCACGSYLSKHYFVAEWPGGSPLQEDSNTDTETSTSNNMTNDGNDSSIDSTGSNTDDFFDISGDRDGCADDHARTSVPENNATCARVMSAAAPAAALVTPPKPPSKADAPVEEGIDDAIREADDHLAAQHRSKQAVFGRMISRPLNDRDENGSMICVSSYPPRCCGSFIDFKKRDKKIVIMEAGKNVMQYSELGGPEVSEKLIHGSSSTYHTLLLHDPNAGDQKMSGLSIIYYMPVPDTKLWWLSYLTTAKEARLDANKKAPYNRRGYGRMMMWRFINLARRAEGVEEIYLEVKREWNAVKLYQSLQFEEVEWCSLPKGIQDFSMTVSKDHTNPQSQKIQEHVYRHFGDDDYILMRLDLSIFYTK